MNINQSLPSVYYRIQPSSDYYRALIHDVSDVRQLKKAIKRAATPELDAYAATQLIIKAALINSNHILTEVLNDEDSIVSVLHRLHLIIDYDDIALARLYFHNYIVVHVEVPLGSGIFLGKSGLPYEISDFAHIIKSNVSFVDKSMFIADFINSTCQVSMVALPHGFGKSINLSMLRTFFERIHEESQQDKDLHRNLFSKLKIRNTLLFSYDFGNYPVIFLDFEVIHGRNWDEMLDSIRGLIANKYYEHNYIYRYLTIQDQQYFHSIQNMTSDIHSLQQALMTLSEFLARYHRINCLVLIDGLDTPAEVAFREGYYPEAMQFFGGMFQMLLMENDYIYKALLFGILPDAEFCFLNHISVNVSSMNGTSTFGFTQDDVEAFIELYIEQNEIEVSMVEVQFWYGGYWNSKNEIYNPSSIVSFCLEKKFAVYWENKEYISRIVKNISKASSDFKQALWNLLNCNGTSLAADNQEDWNILYHTGYIIITYDNQLIIPNREVLSRLWEIAGPLLMPSSALQDVQGEKKADEGYSDNTYRFRSFAVASEANPFAHYYITPETLINDLETKLVHGQFCLLVGRRQSGKSTICRAIWRKFYHQQEYSNQSYQSYEDSFEMYVVTFNARVDISRGSKAFWKSVCERFNSADQNRFPLSKTDRMDRSTFMGFFWNEQFQMPKPTILIIDEASRLISTGSINHETCRIVNEFVSTLRFLKQNRQKYCLYGLALVGNSSIFELLENHNHPSVFEVDVLFAARFTEEEVNRLFNQFAKDEANFDLKRIAADIFKLTLGHKGLVGACGHFINIQNSIGDHAIISYQDWERSKTFLLEESIRKMPCFNSIVRDLDRLTPEYTDILAKTLRNGTYTIPSFNSALFLLREEILTVKEAYQDGRRKITCAEPILRPLIISHLSTPDLKISENVPGKTVLDQKWLLERTVEYFLTLPDTYFFLTQNISLYHVYSSRTMNANGQPSESAFHFQFAAVLKLLLSKVYPTLTNRVLVEVKERDDNSLRNKRLDILVRDEHKLPAYGFELVVTADSNIHDDHDKRAEYYSKLHDCHTYMVNFAAEDSKILLYFGKEKFYERVTPVNIEMKVAKNGKPSKATIYYSENNKTSVQIHNSQWNSLFND